MTVKMCRHKVRHLGQTTAAPNTARKLRRPTVVSGLPDPRGVAPQHAERQHLLGGRR
jgi:hypothetical protein